MTIDKGFLLLTFAVKERLYFKRWKEKTEERMRKKMKVWVTN